MRKIEEEQGARLVHIMTRIILGSFVGLLFCLVFLLICSACISVGILKETMMYQLAMIGSVIGGLAGGLWTVNRCRSRTLMIGLSTGFIFFLLLLTVGVLFFDSITPKEGGLGFLCGSLCGGAIAGLLFGNSKKKRR